MRKPTFFQKGVTALLSVALSYSTFGCANYTSPFVYKTEDELEAMEYTSTSANQYFKDNLFSSAQSAVEGLCEEQTVSRPLYQLELLSTLLLQGEKEKAHELMKAIQYDLEILFDQASEEMATSFWHGEQNKVFKGENHERAIFYALFAMSFIERGEYEDALRCVKNGLLADASTEDEGWNSDFALLHYLGYIAARHANETPVAEDYKREYLTALQNQGYQIKINGNPWTALVDDSTLPNAFLIVWSGEPPTYVRGGAHDEVRHVIPGHDNLTFLTVEAPNTQAVTAACGLGDVNFQATTRGGRAMDNVLANKAMLKSGFEASRTSFLIIAGALVNAEADIRVWRNLPANFFIVPLHLSEGEQEVALHGYYHWDEVLTEKVQLQTQPGKTVTKHYSIIPARNRIKEPILEYIRTRADLSLDLITDKHWLNYEATE